MADLTIREAAAELGVSAEWLRKQAAARLVACHRYGRLVRFTPEDLATIRDQHASPANEEATAQPTPLRLVPRGRTANLPWRRTG